MKFTYQPDGSATYKTMDGDVLDQIAFRFYGTHEETTVLLYENNRDLAKVEQPFAAGIVIKLPPKPSAPVQTGQIKLWD